MDPTQTLKMQLGELLFNNAVLLAQIEDLKKQLEDKEVKADA